MNDKTKPQVWAYLLLICMLSNLLWMPMSSFSETSGDYTYSINADPLTCTITNYNGPGGVVVIPSNLGGCRVTAIGENAFKNNATLTSVTIPNGVTSIGKRAFIGSLNLQQLSIPNSVSDIGMQSFSNCYVLENLKLPTSLVTVGSFAFSNCRKIKTVTIPNQLSRIPGSMFYECLDLETVNIPNTVTGIDGWAFYNCIKLESLSIPSSVVDVEMAGLYGCDNLKHVYVDGNTSFASNVFGIPLPTPFPSLHSKSLNILSGFPGVITPTHNVGVVSGISHGVIEPSTLLGMKDENIVLRMIPDEGYTFDPSTLKYNDGSSDVPISGTAFAMSDHDIVISGGFVPIPIPTVDTPNDTTTNLKPTWSWNDVTGEGYFRYQLNGGSWSYTTATTYTPTTDLLNGMYTLNVQEMNNNGDWSSAGHDSVEVLSTVTGVAVTPASPTVTKGNSQSFSAIVSGTGGPSQAVSWDVSGGGAGTQISGGGVLTIGANEPAASLTVTATSQLDNTKSASINVTVANPLYALNTSTGTGGVITTGSSGNYAAGTIINLVATPSANYNFAGWSSSNGGSFGNTSLMSTTFTMPSNPVTISANWSIISSAGGTSHSSSRDKPSIQPVQPSAQPILQPVITPTLPAVTPAPVVTGQPIVKTNETVQFTLSKVKKALEQAIQSKSQTLVLPIELPKGAKTLKFDVDLELAKAISKAGIKQLVFKLGQESYTFDESMIRSMNQMKTKKATFAVERLAGKVGKMPKTTFKLESNITGGTLVMTVPYTLSKDEKTSDLQVFTLKEKEKKCASRVSNTMKKRST